MLEHFLNNTPVITHLPVAQEFLSFRSTAEIYFGGLGFENVYV